RGGGGGEVAEEAEEPVAEVAEAVPTEPPAEATGEGGRRRRRRRGRGSGSAEAPVAPDSSPMIETPPDEERPIAQTETLEEPKPAPKRGRRKKVAVGAEVSL